MKLKALKDGFDGFKRIRGPRADGSADGEIFDHTRITLEEREVTVGTGDKAKKVKKYVMPAWCEVVNEKDRDKFIYQGDRALKIQENLERMSREVESKANTVRLEQSPSASADSRPAAKDDPSTAKKIFGDTPQE